MCRRFTTLALAAALAIVMLGAALAPRSASADDLGPLDQPVTADLMASLHKISEKGLTQTPDFGSAPLVSIDDDQAPATGAPLVLYIGAGFCPYCAALRWPLALALMRFGDLSGLRYARSAGKDVFPNTATFSFHTAQFKSDLIEFQSVELQDRDGKKLQQPSVLQRSMFARFDKQPYTQYPGGIPFLYMGGRYLRLGSPFSPESLQDLDWKQIAQRLEQGNNAAWQDIMGEADLLTAALCVVTHQKPASVCTASAIKAAAMHLPKK